MKSWETMKMIMMITIIKHNGDDNDKDSKHNDDNANDNNDKQT